MDERRKNPRRSAETPVRLEVGDQTFDGSLRDICRDAALVETATPVAVGTQVNLSLVLPGSESPLPVQGEVIRTKDGESLAHGLAVLFSDLPSSVVWRIDLYVALGTEGLRESGQGP